MKHDMRKCFTIIKKEDLQAEIDKLQASRENLVDVLERIHIWQRAYPLKVFPKPDLKKAAEVLKDAGMTLDAITADNMRHVLDQIKSMVDLALKEAKEIT